MTHHQPIWYVDEDTRRLLEQVWDDGFQAGSEYVDEQENDTPEKYRQGWPVNPYTKVGEVK